MERRGFEPLTSAVRGRGYEFEYGTDCECLFGGPHRGDQSSAHQSEFLYDEVLHLGRELLQVQIQLPGTSIGTRTSPPVDDNHLL